MHIALAPFTLKSGVTEETLLKASDDFEAAFVKEQEGVLRRILVRDPKGGYADIVFFDCEETMERVVAAEQDSEACAAFWSIMDDGEYSVFEVLKTYER
ncbi:hypothetical protein EV643_14331 [Kribbella sp. VKM Ac-2527]|uniref:ABM domain-containing protein n=1 Tax=Kribbella caucasensis TaxID=2512215 RepID=A0A4R6J3F5_9ACTN|nr:hypothetical protein [Kribbella sp. VKM Ac-2527]TDO29864.1 hypothetical protein EV643_14331 [Kribbella sp. VKM Ac-2527]